MTLEDYPDEAEIVETNFKTDQQADAAEKIESEWPVDLDRLAEEGQHVKMFYKQVLDQFLGPAETDATFAEIKSEYGSLEQWAESDEESAEEDVSDEDEDVPDVEEIEPSDDGTDGTSSAAPTDDHDGATVTATIDVDGDDVDDRRRAWFRAGFREGVEFALENPELFETE